MMVDVVVVGALIAWLLPAVVFWSVLMGQVGLRRLVPVDWALVVLTLVPGLNWIILWFWFGLMSK